MNTPSVSIGSPPAAAPDRTDWRQQLFNTGEDGPVSHVQLPAVAITSLRGILLDIDPGLYRPEVLPGGPQTAPRVLYEQLVEPWLSRHPALAGAEVINSGRGLHVVVRFDEPVVFRTDGVRRRWAGIVKAVQVVLPSDPDAPGITATTRPIGSRNGKNGATVERLRAATPVSPGAVEELYEQLRDKPFKTVTAVLFGSDEVAPCPVCKVPGTRLLCLDKLGTCYGTCGKVYLGRLHAAFLSPRPGPGEAKGGGRGRH
jgi:hypothetical protein